MNNVAIYVDYENIFKRLNEYNVHPINDLNFFEEISKKFKQANFNVLKFVAFSNFADRDFTAHDQTIIRNFGVDVKHCSIDSKSSTDAELMIEVMHDIYRNSQIDTFVIIANDRDYVPLLQAIKLKSKKTYSLTTKNGVNDVINVFADFHQYIEDLFAVESISKSKTNLCYSQEQIDKAMQVSDMLYESGLWTNYIASGQMVSLKGYSSIINKNIWKKESLSTIEGYFQIAHQLGYVKIEEFDGKAYLLEGIKKSEINVKKDEKTLETE